MAGPTRHIAALPSVDIVIVIDIDAPWQTYVRTATACV